MPVFSLFGYLWKKMIIMRNDLTFTIVKPDAMKSGYLGAILNSVILNGFQILALRMTNIDRKLAEEFYAEHRGKPFFEDLLEYMTSGSVVVAVLKKDDAVADFRELIGVTDPAKAKMGSIRHVYAKSKEQNAIHGSDSNESAAREMKLFFPDL